ncbi:MAG: hypothetical protein LBD44_03790 [Spirochaetaceae bacterium]|nr:hypothetical protein [Spirochaetaceae bacterium]
MKSFQNRDFGNTQFPPSALPVFFVSLFFTPFASCSLSQPREALPYSVPSTQVSRIVEILDYEGRASGAELPEWVSLYINYGVSALEKLDEFASHFVFVAEQSSPNLDTLLQWSNNFSLDRDVPQLVLLRVYRRLTGNLSVNPDDLYGGFFETFIKSLASRRWPPAQKYYETWVLVRRIPVFTSQDTPDSDMPDEDVLEQALSEEEWGSSFDSRLYMYLILNVIEKNEVESSMKLIMNDITLGKSLSRDQVQAINSIKSNLFNGF